MRRITIWLLSTIAALVLLFSYRTSTMGAGFAESAQVAGAGTGTAATTDGSTGTSGSSSGGEQTYDGSVVQTRWGPVQVRIVVVDGKITEVEAVQYPNSNRRDVEINSRALPVLAEWTIEAQSADIDTVSGATVTSDGYRESLQSAIDAAHLR